MPFVDLFLARDRWKAEHIKPYLSEIAVDANDLDKLLLKYSKALMIDGQRWLMVHNASPVCWKRNTVVLCSPHSSSILLNCNHYLSLRRLF